MSLRYLTITNLRSIEQAELNVPPGLSLVWGGNGSGKTSLLEAMFLLGRGRSFRTRNTARLIRRGQDHLRVIGRTDTDIQRVDKVIGFELGPSGVTARMGGRPADSLAELSRAFPVQVIDPGVHKLIEEGGHRRRRWVDWAVFHVEPRFIETWTRYTRALKQRNAALRIDPVRADLWDLELARLGESIAESRARLVQDIEPHWQAAIAGLAGLPVELHYLRGWNREHTLAEALAASRSRDQVRRLTHAGPHRADIAVRLQGRPARELLSRGQQKLVAVAMTLAQLRLLQTVTDATPTLLLDDPAAELDGDHLERFIGQVAQLRCQLVVTSLHAESRLFGSPERTFRMDQGRVIPV